MGAVVKREGDLATCNIALMGSFEKKVRLDMECAPNDNCGADDKRCNH